MKRLIILAVILTAVLAPATPALASRPSPESTGKGRICVKTQQYPPIFRCFWR